MDMMEDSLVPQENKNTEDIEVLHSTIITEADNGNTNEETNVKISSIEEELPDVLRLTIKNLDTGEQFIIGENDPDFDFDTFELRRGVEATPIIDNEEAKITNKRSSTIDSDEQKIQNKAERISWWRQFLSIIYGTKDSKPKNVDMDQLDDSLNQQSQKARTPFTKLSNFKFRKELGRGAFGRVLLAESKADGSLFALKIITKKNMRSSDKRQAKAERDILHAMTLKAPHPFTSGLKFAFQSENNLYLGMDFIPGGNLRELIKKFKFLPEDWVRFYAAELVLAISHLHSMNVLYRDIKPHNVMIDGRGHAILIDFGLSKQEIVHPRGALSLVGTPDYSAPEVLKTGVQQIEQHNRERAAQKGKGTAGSSSKSSSKIPPKIGYGKAADWWSLGIMIYEMLSGTPTFRGSDLRQTYQKILYADLDFFPEERFSMPARLLLAGLIKRDPSTRLGAWENPPQDIMMSSFFNGIKWDAIYERQIDGPYIPEPINFGSSKKSNNLRNPADGTVAKLKLKNQHHTTRDKNKNPESDDDSESEVPGMRDSLFIQPHDGGGNNLLDWSFIDEKVLVSSVGGKDNIDEKKLPNPSNAVTVVNDSNTSTREEGEVLKKKELKIISTEIAVVGNEPVDGIQNNIITTSSETAIVPVSHLAPSISEKEVPKDSTETTNIHTETNSEATNIQTDTIISSNPEIISDINTTLTRDD